MSKVCIYTSIFIAAIIILTGCASSQSKVGYCREKGYLNANIYDSVKSPCKVVFRYRNLAKQTQKPVIDIISYNDAEEIINYDKIYFEEVGGGTTRQLTKVIECQGKNISKIYIRDARDSARCYGYKCSVLCGIKGLTIKVMK